MLSESHHNTIADTEGAKVAYEGDNDENNDENNDKY